MREATRVIRSTLTKPVPGEPLHSGPVFAAPFHVMGDPGATAYTYGRSHNPTWTELERAIGLMEVLDGHEAAEVRCFGSGMAAVAAAFGATLGAGDTVVLAAGAYFLARQLLEEVFVPAGVRVRTIPAEEFTEPAAVAGAKLVWVESPSNPELEITDIGAVCRVAHAAGALVACDNTTATPLGQRPLELGADLSVCSDSKAMNGASDVLMGHVATRDRALLAKVDRQRTLTGAVPGPLEAWLLLRSLATLPLRLAQSSANALALAEFLGARSEVSRVLYPGLKTHPGHEVAAAQMRHFGPILSFTLRDQQAAERFLAAANLITEATSFGGVVTTAERRARGGHDGIAPGFSRLSAGCEDSLDLIEDCGKALEATA